MKETLHKESRDVIGKHSGMVGLFGNLFLVIIKATVGISEQQCSYYSRCNKQYGGLCLVSGNNVGIFSFLSRKGQCSPLRSRSHGVHLRFYNIIADFNYWCVCW